MSEAAETNKGGLWLGLLIGGALGAAASLLLAPKSGSALREDLSNTYKSLHEKKRRLASTVKEKAQDVANSIGNHASELSEKAKEGKQIVADTVQAVKEDIQGRNGSGA
ncbi:YtxH domain-containing protein [Paenibacillus sp. MBLB4367]|uniref:YtxH domain-containing protein n=1 Tax=Paenibacillus sp. MBLB4367 TaxID=3384767 RepID=UPI00390822A8